MYKLSLKPFTKTHWMVALLLIFIYCFTLDNLSMLSVLLFHNYITLICNHIYIFYLSKKTSMVVRIMPSLIARLGYKKFTNKHILNSFLEMLIFSLLIYGPLIIFQAKYMLDFEWQLLPIALILNTMLYCFITICFCLKILTNNRWINQILTFFPIFANIVFHYLLVPRIFEPIYALYSQFFY